MTILLHIYIYIYISQIKKVYVVEATIYTHTVYMSFVSTAHLALDISTEIMVH